MQQCHIHSGKALVLSKSVREETIGTKLSLQAVLYYIYSIKMKKKELHRLRSIKQNYLNIQLEDIQQYKLKPKWKKRLVFF